MSSSGFGLVGKGLGPSVQKPRVPTRVADTIDVIDFSQRINIFRLIFGETFMQAHAQGAGQEKQLSF